MSILTSLNSANLKSPKVKRRTSSRSSARQRSQARRLHVTAGLLVGPFLLIASLTGFFYALAPSIESVAYKNLYTATSEQPARPVGEQIRVAQARHPEWQLSAVQSDDDPKKTTRVLFVDDRLPSSSYRHAVFVDPGDLDIKGEYIQYGSSNASPLRTWLSVGHKNLWLGDAGRWYSELAASWLGAIALAGLWLWAKQTRRKTMLKTDAGKLRQRHSSWHSTLGLWLLPGMLFLTITGLTWSGIAGQNIGYVRQALNWKAPAVQAQLSGGGASTSLHAEHEHSGGGHVMNPDGVLARARGEGLTGLVEATPPPAHGDAWVVKEARGPWRFSIDSLAIDPATTQVVDRVPFSAWPFPAKATNWLIELHMGILFGLFSQVALAFLALGIIAVTVLGYVMWWRSARTGLPTRAGFSLALAVILALYALVAPLFGLSLLAFVLIDALSRIKPKKTPQPVKAEEQIDQRVEST